MQLPTSKSRARLGSLLSVALSALGALLLLGPAVADAAVSGRAPGAMTSAARQLPGAAPGSDRLDKLTAEIKRLEKRYRGELLELRDARDAAKRAVDRANGLKRELATARGVVAQIAASEYINSGVDPAVQLLSSEDPAAVLDGATLASHLSRNKAAEIQQIQTLVRDQDKARKDAQDKIAALRRTLKNLQAQRARVQRLLNKFKPESPLMGGSGITPRMLRVRNEVDRRFGPFPVIGCLRPGDPQDHGSGRACDFMESTGGVMPTPERQQNGDAVASWAIANASAYGIKYIIWRQRIWDIRSGGGWKTMEDRGGITANHYDHVHISVF